MKTKHFNKLFGGVLLFLFCAAFELYAGGGGGGGGARGGGGGGGGLAAAVAAASAAGSVVLALAASAVAVVLAAVVVVAAAAQAAANTTPTAPWAAAQIYRGPERRTKLWSIADEVTAKQIQEVLAQLDAPAAAGAHPGCLP